MDEFDPKGVDLPQALLRADLSGSVTSTYVIDRDKRLVYTDEGWRYFAIANGGADLLLQWRWGKPVMDCVPGVLKAYYQEIYRRAFAGEVVRNRYQCSSPSEYREYEMTFVASADGRFVLAFNVCVTEQAMFGLDVGYGAAFAMYCGKDARVTQCAHCRKVMRRGHRLQWDFVPMLLRLGAFEVSDALCPACVHWHEIQRGRWVTNPVEMTDGRPAAHEQSPKDDTERVNGHRQAPDGDHHPV